MSSSSLREASEDDADAIAALFAASFGDARRVDAEEVRSWLRNEEIKPENVRVLEVAGRVVGYGDVWVEDGEVELDAAAPGHWEPFLEWAESRGSLAAVFCPPGHELAALAESRGYRYVRSSLTMQIELTDAPSPSPLPAGIAVRTYRDEDAEPLRAALNEAFVDGRNWHAVSATNFREFYLRARGFDPELWLLAFDGTELVGFSLAYGGRAGDPELGWVGTLGVRRPWRRRGLGEALLRRSFAALYDRGFRRIGLGVDAENPMGARRLYERAGMHEIRRQDRWERRT